MFLRLFAITVFILVLGFAAQGRANELAKNFTPTTPIQALPNFNFADEKGVNQTLEGFRGRYILLNLWASWCAPCVEEMPSLNALRDKFDFKDLNIIALNVDRNGTAIAQAFMTRHNLKNLLAYVDTSGRVPYTLKTRGLPTTFLIDREGREIGRVEGAVNWSSPDAIAFLRTKITQQ